MSNPAPPGTTIIDLRRGDWLTELAKLPASSVVVVTSPPQLGCPIFLISTVCRVRTILNGCMHGRNRLHTCSSQKVRFLNVGSTPANPLLLHQIVLLIEPLLRLENTIHWIKSITIQPRREAEFVGRPLQTDPVKAIPHRLPRIRVPSYKDRRSHNRPIGDWSRVRGQEQHREMGPHFWA